MFSAILKTLPKRNSCLLAALFAISIQAFRFQSSSNKRMPGTEQVTKGQAIFFSQARPRLTQQQQQQQEEAQGAQSQILADQDQSTIEQPSESAAEPSRVASIIKLIVFAWFTRWFIRYFEIDRSLRQEPETPHISMTWLYLAMLSLLPFVFVYFYASIWRRRILREPLDLQNWQASASSLVHFATVGLLAAWTFAIIALFPGYGFKAVLITIVCTICSVGLVDSIEGVF